MRQSPFTEGSSGSCIASLPDIVEMLPLLRAHAFVASGRQRTTADGIVELALKLAIARLADTDPPDVSIGGWSDLCVKSCNSSRRPALTAWFIVHRRARGITPCWAALREWGTCSTSETKSSNFAVTSLRALVEMYWRKWTHCFPWPLRTSNGIWRRVATMAAPLHGSDHTQACYPNR